MRMRKRSFVGERVENRSVSGGEAEGGQGSLDEGDNVLAFRLSKR